MNESTKKTIVFTGATSGLGLISALDAAALGHYLIVLARNENSEKAFKAEFLKEHGKKSLSIDFVKCDLSSFDSVKSAIESIHKLTAHIDILVNNAGMWNTEFKETIDGYEETYQVNLLTPVYLLEALLPLLQKAEQPKYIVTASGLHQGTINFEDIQYRANWNGFKAYRQSKLGVILMCRLFAKAYPDITFCSQHPGVVRTNLGNKFGWLSRTIFFLIGKSAKKGAMTLTHLINAPTDNLVSGEYYANKKITKITSESNDLELAKNLKEVIDTELKKF